jgi:hypothetical protein
MGYRLRREVRDALPPGLLTAGERLLVLELADICGDDTREGWPGIAKLATLTDMSGRSIQQTLNRVGKKWIELRVPLGRNDDGKVYYAHAGRRTVYRFPVLKPSGGAMDECPSGATDERPPSESGATDRSEWCDGSVEEVRQMSDPSPQGTSQKFNHSSLSVADVEAPGSTVVNEADRERDESASQRSKTHQLLLEAGCPDDDLDDVEDELKRRFEVRSPAWFRTVHGNGELAALVGEVLEALNGTTATAPSRKAFMETLVGEPECGHGIEGGNIAWDHDGWMLCSTCRRLAGWTEVNNQGRTDGQDPRRKRSVSVLRAEQALAVAAELDALYPREIRSPADQRVADGAVLYEKYRRLEGEPA